MLIVYSERGRGWAPITYMVKLAAHLLDAELIILDNSNPSFLNRLESYLLSRQVNHQGESVLLICPSPTEMQLLMHFKDWRKRFNFIGAWIIDSFWIDWVPRFAKSSSFFDHIFVTTEEDIPDWERITESPVTWLPWGSDALRFSTVSSERTLDLVRVGRQPVEWNINTVNSQKCREKNISFLGSPTMYTDPVRNQETLMEVYSKTKFILAFTNSVNPTYYTHPSREYLTARWVDSLACGAIVAGIVPDEPSIKRQLWQGATLDLGTIKREEGLEIIKDALRSWSVEQAEHNKLQALKYLDWRWRFAEIAKNFNLPAKNLVAEISLLKESISNR